MFEARFWPSSPGQLPFPFKRFGQFGMRMFSPSSWHDGHVMGMPCVCHEFARGVPWGCHGVVVKSVVKSVIKSVGAYTVLDPADTIILIFFKFA